VVNVDYESHLMDQFLDDVEFLVTLPSRATLEDAGNRLGATPSMIEHRLRRAGRMDLYDRLVANGGTTVTELLGKDKRQRRRGVKA
jgi:hypothetical protein